MVKRWIGILSLCLLLCLPKTGMASSDNLVIDDAGLLDSFAFENISQELKALNEEFGVDFIFVTTADVQGKNPTAYADDFYDEKYGINHDGGILLIDMDNREVVLSLSGKAIDVVTDGRQEKLLDKVFSYLSEGEYGKVANTYIESIREYMVLGVPEGQHRVEVKRPGLDTKDAVIASLSGLGAGGGFFSLKRKRYKFKPKGKNFPLMENSLVNMHLMKDHLLDTRVTTRIIPKPSNNTGDSSNSTSSVYRSSSGGTHSSSSRKF